MSLLPIRETIIYRKAGGGSWVEYSRAKARYFIDDSVSIGVTYQYKVVAVDTVGNMSSDSNIVSVTPAKIIDDDLIVDQGVSGPSIAHASINTQRIITATGSFAGTILPGVTVQVTLDKYVFASSVYTGAAFTYLTMLGASGAGSEDYSVAFRNDNPGSVNYELQYRKITP